MPHIRPPVYLPQYNWLCRLRRLRRLRRLPQIYARSENKGKMQGLVVYLRHWQCFATMEALHIVLMPMLTRCACTLDSDAHSMPMHTRCPYTLDAHTLSTPLTYTPIHTAPATGRATTRGEGRYPMRGKTDKSIFLCSCLLHWCRSQPLLLFKYRLGIGQLLV